MWEPAVRLEYETGLEHVENASTSFLQEELATPLVTSVGVNDMVIEVEFVLLPFVTGLLWPSMALFTDIEGGTVSRMMVVLLLVVPFASVAEHVRV